MRVSDYGVRATRTRMTIVAHITCKGTIIAGIANPPNRAFHSDTAKAIILSG